MPKTLKSPVAKFRRRMKREGFVRVEVQVRKQDAALMRGVASALADPELEAETRALLQSRLAGSRAVGLKALLASAPLEGIDLKRPRDTGRKVEL